jgi:response regulator RpfG family c-di-GMP phosphodiesterase
MCVCVHTHARTHARAHTHTHAYIYIGVSIEELAARCAELEAALARQEWLHRTHISALHANTSAARYNEGRDRGATLKRLQDEMGPGRDIETVAGRKATLEMGTLATSVNENLVCNDIKGWN